MAMVAPPPRVRVPVQSLSQLLFVLLCFPVARAEIWDGVEASRLRLVLLQLADSILCAHARFGHHTLDCAHEIKA
jgi:hypothetical protein